MFLGRRIGAERALQMAERKAKRKRKPADFEHDDTMNMVFSEDFGPAEVFRAWWSVAEDMRDPNLSVPAFRLRIEGAFGVSAAWSCMREAIAPERLSVEEVWFYGSELLRTLAEIDLPSAKDRDAKTRLLLNFRGQVRRGLEQLGFDAGTRPWVRRLLAFYGQTAA